MMKEKKIIAPLLLNITLSIASLLVMVNSLGRETWRVAFSLTGFLIFSMFTFLLIKKALKK